MPPSHDAVYNLLMGYGLRAFRKSRERQRGQVAILFALVFTFMLILFAMVVDIAHLINNKINLQLAADSAAYAGAAWQARVLNRIAAVNYRMRQDVKELSMRLNVTHLRHNRNFPRGGDVINGAPGVSDVDAFICQQAHGYISESGVRYADDTNLCRNASAATGGLPPIVVPPVIAAFDPFEAAIAAQIRRIADAADQQCAAAAHDNQDLAQHLASVYSARSRFHLRQIQGLMDFVNDVDPGEASANSRNPIAQAAYQSAFRNLTPANHNKFKLEILAPALAGAGASGGAVVQSASNVPSRYLALEQQELAASILYVNFNVVGDGCVGQPGFLDFGGDGNGIIAGVSKIREVLTYFAVRASAVPDLVFLPEVWFTNDFPLIEAYSAAKPFGSRIGPEPGIDSLMPVSGRVGNQSRIINFSFFPRDNLGMMNRKMMALFDAFHPVNGQSRPEGNQNRGWPDFGGGNSNAGLRIALQAIHAPTIFDALFYTIFPDPGGNAGNDYVEPQFAQALYPDYLEAFNGQNGTIQLPAGTPSPYFANYLGQGADGGYIKLASDDTGTGPGAYAGYAEESPISHGVTTAIGLPFITDSTARDLGFATKDLVHSGWTPVTHSGSPRIGYSVKFVGFDALTGKLQVTVAGQGQKRIANPPSPVGSDPGAANLRQIIH